MSLVMLCSFLCSTQWASDSSSYRMKTPNSTIIAICQTKQTAGRLTRTFVFLRRPKKLHMLSQQFPMVRSDGLLMLPWSLLSQRLLLQCDVQESVCKRDYIYINLRTFLRVCSDAPLRNRGWTPVHSQQESHSLLAHLCLLLKPGWHVSGVTSEIKSWLCERNQCSCLNNGKCFAIFNILVEFIA